MLPPIKFRILDALGGPRATIRCTIVGVNAHRNRGRIKGQAMDDPAIRAALERHWSDINDQDVVHQIYDDDVVLEFPQGGERLVGLANVRAMRETYPPKVALRTERIRGSGELWVAENVITYGDTMSMHTVNIMEFRNGKVMRETIYVGDPWEPPAWRAQWVELVEPATAQLGQGITDAP